MPMKLGETLPFTHEQAVRTLMAADWTEEEARVIRDGGVVCLHHGFGTHMRNVWGLHNRTYPLNKHYREKYGIGHGDDMSQLILQDFVGRMRGEQPIRIEIEACWLKKHWQDQGVDPLTLERISCR